MLTRIKAFLISVSIAMGLVAIHTSVTNLLWLSSIDMPISIGIVISTIASDIIGMSFQGEVPVVALILIGLLIGEIATISNNERTIINNSNAVSNTHLTLPPKRIE